MLGEGLRSPPASSNGQEHHGKSLAANVVMHRGVIGRLAPAPARQIPIWKLGMLLFAETSRTCCALVLFQLLNP